MVLGTKLGQSSSINRIKLGKPHSWDAPNFLDLANTGASWNKK